MDLQRLRDPRWIDGAIAAFFALGLQLEIWIWWVPHEQGPRPFAAVMGLLMTAPLLWRRRAPLACLATSAAVLVVWTVVAVPQGSLWTLLTTLALTFSLAIHAPAGRAVAGLVLIAGAWIFFVAWTTNSAGDYGFIEAFVVAAWVAGRALRARQLRADELFERTVRLEVERDQKVREAAEHERMRIARELHDIISHSVSVMVVQAGAAQEVLERDQAQVRASLQSIQDTGRQARVELRRLLGLMRTNGDAPELAPQPSLAQLATLVEQLRPSGLEVELDVSLPDDALSPGIALAVYRIVQEALTNALKHGGPGRSRVSVRRDGETIEVEVLNEGRARADAGAAGFGLVGMNERVAVYGGELAHGRRDDGWYELRARLPLGSGAR
jgi:signal transduction histidine kinase